MAQASVTDFLGFSLSLQANIAVVLQTGHDQFLPRPFQFIMHQPFMVWWWIPILTQLNGYNLLILCTMYCDIGRLVSGKLWLQAVHHGSGDCRVCHIQMKNVYSEAVLCPFNINSKPDWDCLQSFVTKADQNMMQLNLMLEYVAAENVAANLLPKWVRHVICRTRTSTEWSGRL